MASVNPTSVSDLLDLSGASKEARAYAFLYAAFKRTEIGANPVKDVIDCLVPFIAPYINKIAGEQVAPQGVQGYLKSSFGFDLPLYAIEQILPTLQSHKLVEYRAKARVYVALATEIEFDLAKNEIVTDFEEIESSLQMYARRLGFEESPPSGSWGQAIVNFLRSRSDKTIKKFTKLKDVMLDAKSAEAATVAGFLTDLHLNEPERFKKIVRVFMGALIEDFISSIAEIGSVRSDNPVVVFYDTALLLRMLGCSGKILKQATLELTRYLQDLGFKIEFLSGNDAEVSNIIDTIISLQDSGSELEGETALAIAAGEVSTTDLRALQHVFAEHLAVHSIFPATNTERSAQENANFQINERGLSEHIKKAAQDSQRRYGHQNSLNDAGYIGTVMRLRKGIRTRDLAECRYLFATSNRFLALQSKRYLISEKQLVSTSVPPALPVGQIATIAWLLKDHTLPPERASRELLTNCFAAVRPDAEWFGYFKEGLEKVIGDTEAYAVDEGRALTLQAARRIAQDESFGNSVIMRKLNMAEVLSRAEAESERALAQREEEARRAISKIEELKEKALEDVKLKADEELSRLKDQLEKSQVDFENSKLELEERHSIILLETRRRAEVDTLNEIKNARNLRADRAAGFIIFVFKATLVVTFCASTAYAIFAQLHWIANDRWKAHAAIFSSLVAIIRFLDWLKFRFLMNWRENISARISRLFGHS